MNKNKYRYGYESKFYNIPEAIEILKKCPPDVLIKLYHKYRKRLVTTMKGSKEGQITLATLSEKIDNLNNDLNCKINNLNDKVDAGFKQVNTRIDKIDARLDYIVKANKLKDLPKNSHQ